MHFERTGFLPSTSQDRRLAQHLEVPTELPSPATSVVEGTVEVGWGDVHRFKMFEEADDSQRFVDFFGLWEIGWNALTWYEIGIFNGMCVEVWVETSYSHLYLAYVARKTGSIHNFQVAAMLFTESQGVYFGISALSQRDIDWGIRISQVRRMILHLSKVTSILIKDKSGLFLKRR